MFKKFAKFLITILIVAIIGVSIWFLLKDNNNPNEEAVEQIIEYPNFKVKATKESDELIELNTSFTLEADKETTLEIVKGCFSVTPEVPYEIIEVRNDYYSLALKEDLKPNTIYNIEYKTDKAPYKWSFQTEESFKVVSYYPIDDVSYYAAPNTTLEFVFSYLPNDNIEEYFKITPEIKGKFVYNENDRRVIFQPNEKFKTSTTYTVELLEGFGNKENDKIFAGANYKLRIADSNASAGYEQYSSNISFENNIYTFGTNEEPYINFSDYGNKKINAISLTIYQYKNSGDFKEDIIQKSEYGNRMLKKPVDVTRLDKIIEEKILDEEIIEYDYCCYIAKINSKLSEGYYMVLFEANNEKFYIPLQINDITCVTDYFDQDTLLIWANDLPNNMPLTGAEIKVDDKKIGITNSQGYLYKQNIEMPDKNNVIFSVQYEGRATLYGLIDARIYGHKINQEAQYINSHIRLDRAVFKPNENVQVWGFVKDRRGTEYKECTVKLLYDYSTVLQENKIKLDEFGSFTTAFNLENFAEGYYEIILSVAGNDIGYAYFQVKEYATATYDLIFDTDKKNIKNGEKVTFDILACLYDGTVIPNAKVKISAQIDNKTIYNKTLYTDDSGKITDSILINIDKTYANSKGCSLVAILGDNEDQISRYGYINVYTSDIYYDVDFKQNSDYNYNVTLNAYNYDYTDMNNIKREGSILTEPTVAKFSITKHRYEKVVTSTYYNEDTKTMEEKYRIDKAFDGTEELEVDVINGKAQFNYQSPYANNDEGIIDYTVYLEKPDKSGVIYTDYAYVSRYYTNANYEMSTALKDIVSNRYKINVDDEIKYKVNDDIDLKLIVSEGCEMPKHPYVMYIMKSAKGVEVFTTRDTNYKLKFREEYGADIIIHGFVFDGRTISSIYRTYRDWGYSFEPYMEYSLSKEELEMELDINFDKQEYKPGEIAKATINTKINGKPVSSVVNLSAINAEFIAENYTYNYGPIYSLHNNYYFANHQYSMSHTIIMLNDYADGGGGGGEGERTNFQTTAIFETVYTDENGLAEIEIELPDNITTWKLNAQCVAKGYRGGSLDKDIKVTLPFYTTPVIKDKYLVNETPIIDIRCNGMEVKSGDSIKYTVKIKNPSGEETAKQYDSKVGKYLNVPLPKLEKGTYELTVKAECKGYTDTIVRKFEAVVTHQETMVTTKCDLTAVSGIQVDKGVATLYLYNSDVDKYIDELFKLSSLNRIRNDKKAIGYMADKILAQLQGRPFIKRSPFDYLNSNIIPLEVNGEGDTLFTAKLMSIGIYDGKEYDIAGLEKIIDENSDIRETCWAYWALAAHKEPVLKELNELREKVSNYTDKAIIGLAYADIGNYDKASEIYEEIRSALESNYVSYDEAFEYLTMLAYKLNKPERETLYQKYLTLNRASEYSNFVELMRIQNEVKNNTKKASIVLEINGEEKTYEIRNVGITTVSIKSTDNVRIKKASENASARIKKNEIILPESQKYNGYITKKYYVNGKEAYKFKVGDVVDVQIKINYYDIEGSGAKSIYCTVEDVLPECMQLIDEYRYYGENVIMYPNRISGQKMSFSASRHKIYSYYSNSYKIMSEEIRYQALVTTKGQFIADGIILKNDDNMIIDYIEPIILNVE